MSGPESAADTDGAHGQGIGTTMCVNCGSLIDEYEWFPIRGREDDDGEFRLYSFCSEDCVESWEISGA